jgi:hypothetical protein
MTSPTDSSRIFRIQEADTTLPDDIPSRACTVTGCTGTMYLHDPIEDLPPPSHLEFPRYATWVCAQDSAHVELLTFSQWIDQKRGRAENKGQRELIAQQLAINRARQPKSRRGWLHRWTKILRKSSGSE